MDRQTILRHILTRKWITGQWKTLPLASQDLRGKTIIVTGANRGLGFEVAKHFARLNVSRLILACRSEDSANRAALKIAALIGGTTHIEGWQLDLAVFASVSAFATRFQKEGLALDILVLNAGIMHTQYQQTIDGWESMLQVNYLSSVLLAILLLPYFTQSDVTDGLNPRIVLVSSETHYFLSTVAESDSPHILSKMNDRLYCTETRSVMASRYFLTKLLGVFFTRQLATIIHDSAVTVVAASPGFCASGIDVEAQQTLAGRIGSFIAECLIARTAEMGSRAIIHAAVNPGGRSQNGRYMESCVLETESAFVLSNAGAAVQKRVWTETLDILSAVEPKVKDVLIIPVSL